MPDEHTAATRRCSMDHRMSTMGLLGTNLAAAVATLCTLLPHGDLSLHRRPTLAHRLLRITFFASARVLRTLALFLQALGTPESGSLCDRHQHRDPSSACVRSSETCPAARAAANRRDNPVARCLRDAWRVACGGGPPPATTPSRRRGPRVRDRSRPRGPPAHRPSLQGERPLVE